MSDQDVQELLANYSPAVRELALQLRKLVRGLMPGAEEKVYAGWKTIGYSVGGGMKGQFCSISPAKDHVKLFLTRGVELDDPGRLLEGTGKGLRHIKITTPEAVNKQEVKALIEAAADAVKSS